VITYLLNPANPASPLTFEPTADQKEGARAKGVQLQVLWAGNEGELDAAFATLGQSQDGAVFLGPDPFFNSRAEHLVAAASRYSVPAMYYKREFVAAGGLISYGPSHLGYLPAGRQLRCSDSSRALSPPNLPVVQPTRFELVHQSQDREGASARWCRKSLLARADEVIE